MEHIYQECHSWLAHRPYVSIYLNLRYVLSQTASEVSIYCTKLDRNVANDYFIHQTKANVSMILCPIGSYLEMVS